MADLSLGVVFPGPAREGLGSLAVWRLLELARREGVRAERFFLDPGRPPRSRESGLKPADFDLLAFSLPCEEQWTQVPWLLQNAGISLRAEVRRSGEPLVLLGGFSLRLNPWPLSPFADALVTGDAEPVFGEICRAAAEGAERRELLRKLAHIEGVWVPALVGRPPPAVLFTGDLPAVQQRAEPESVFSRMLLVETGRGCPSACKFCAVSHSGRPHFFSARAIGEAVQAGRRPGLAAGLVGASFSWHPELPAVAGLLEGARVNLGLASLDARRLASAGAEVLLRAVQRSALRTVTLAPEAGSERLRRAAGKPLSDEQLECAARRVLEAGAVNLKLYVMYGLPDEGDDDLRAVVELARRARNWMNAAHRRQGRTGQLTISANPLVPKPTTPWGGVEMPPPAELRRRLELLRRGIGPLGGVSLGGMPPRAALLQWSLDRCDAAGAQLLEPSAGRPPPPTLLLRRMKKMLESRNDMG